MLKIFRTLYYSVLANDHSLLITSIKDVQLLFPCRHDLWLYQVKAIFLLWASTMQIRISEIGTNKFCFMKNVTTLAWVNFWTDVVKLKLVTNWGDRFHCHTWVASPTITQDLKPKFRNLIKIMFPEERKNPETVIS